MYGAILTRPLDDADLDVFFINTEGYSPMCGHAILAITKVVLETGIIRKRGDHPELVINVPPGRNYARAVVDKGEVRNVSFRTSHHSSTSAISMSKYPGWVASHSTSRSGVQTKFGPYDAVIPEVGGTAHIMGKSELYFDPKDPFTTGFIFR